MMLSPTRTRLQVATLVLAGGGGGGAILSWGNFGQNAVVPSPAFTNLQWANLKWGAASKNLLECLARTF